MEKTAQNNFLCSVCFEEFPREKAVSCSKQNINYDSSSKKKLRLSSSKIGNLKLFLYN